jgi:hypothetical protein
MVKTIEKLTIAFEQKVVDLYGLENLSPMRWLY